MIESAAISTILLDHLAHLCSLPSDAQHPEQLAAVAARLAERMQRTFQTDVVATAGAPVVVGRRAGRSPFTVLLYHHYDVAPAGSWRAWNHEPFQLAERDDTLYGRGVAGGKGALAAQLAALEALIAVEGELPCGVVLVVEGEALSGSQHLAAAVEQLQPHVRVDACLATGGERNAAGRPLCYSGAKGLLQLQLRATGANQPLASGHAGTVSNPLWRLVWALGQIKNEQEEILIEGFYDSVDGPARGDTQRIKATQFDEAARLAAWGIDAFALDMQGIALVRAETLLPTCNIGALSAEPHGEGLTIPTSALAYVDMQLVPSQQPELVVEQLRQHLAAKELADIAVERLAGGYGATRTPPEHPFVEQVRTSGTAAFGEPLTHLPFGSFALPLGVFATAFGAPVATLGFARPDSAQNGPNEHIRMGDAVEHAQLLAELLKLCASS